MRAKTPILIDVVLAVGMLFVALGETIPRFSWPKASYLARQVGGTAYD